MGEPLADLLCPLLVRWEAPSQVTLLAEDDSLQNYCWHPAKKDIVSDLNAFSGVSLQIICWLFLLLLCCTPGSKAAAVEYSNSMYHVGSPVGAAPLQVVQLAEDLKLALELQPNQEERESLRAQLPSETTQALINWLQNGEVSKLPSFSTLLSINVWILLSSPTCRQIYWSCRHLSISCCRHLYVGISAAVRKNYIKTLWGHFRMSSFHQLDIPFK